MLLGKSVAPTGVPVRVRVVAPFKFKQNKRIQLWQIKTLANGAKRALPTWQKQLRVPGQDARLFRVTRNQFSKEKSATPLVSDHARSGKAQ